MSRGFDSVCSLSAKIPNHLGPPHYSAQSSVRLSALCVRGVLVVLARANGVPDSTRTFSSSVVYLKPPFWRKKIPSIPASLPSFPASSVPSRSTTNPSLFQSRTISTTPKLSWHASRNTNRVSDQLFYWPLSRPQGSVYLHLPPRSLYPAASDCSLYPIPSKSINQAALKNSSPSKPADFMIDVGASGRAKRSYHAPFEQTTSDRSSPTDPFLLSVQVGEDAYFTRPDGMAVSDGVGGWRGIPGANPALYALKMMHYACQELALADTGDGSCYTVDQYRDLCPRNVLGRAFANTIKDLLPNGVLGSCTAALSIVRGQELRISNIGDSGILVIRDRTIVFQNLSAAHQISFNFPYQLGSQSGLEFPVDQVQLFPPIPLKEGDIIIMGTDGVFDNLFEGEIVTMCQPESLLALTRRRRSSGSPTVPQLLAEAIITRAYEVSLDQHAYTPFVKGAFAAGREWVGGKRDDMTCVCGVVRVQGDSPDRR